MYKTTISLLVAGYLWMATAVQAQNIVITVDKDCIGSVMVDNQIIPYGGVYNFAVSKADVFQVFYNKVAAAANVIITIKSAPHVRPAFEKSNVQDVLSNNNFFSSLRNLVKAPQGQVQMNLSQPFIIYVGCASRPDTVFYCTFFPMLESAAAPVISSGSQGNIPANTNTVAPAEKEYLPGSAVYDALKLADNNNLSENELQRIVQFYYPDRKIENVAQAKNTLLENPFLKQTVFKPGKNILASAQSSGQLLSSLSLSSIGGLDVTNIVDRLAKFLVKRTKEELNTAFFEKFKEELNKYPDLKTLFPKTVNLLGSIGTEVYNYQKYIQNLRETFKDDIETLYENLPGIIDNHPAFFARHQDLAASLRSGCYLVGALQQKVHPGDVLANYPLEYLDGVGANWKGSVQTLQLLSASMRDTSAANNTYWVNIKYLRQLVNNKNAFVIYMGLIYQMSVSEYDSIHFAHKTLAATLKDMAPSIAKANDVFNTYKTYILRFGEKTDALNSMIASYTKPANDSLAIELYKKYFDASQDLLEYASHVGELPILNRVKFLDSLPALLAPYFRITGLTTDLIVDINRKNYSAAVNDAILIYDWVRNKPAQKDASMVNNKPDADKKAIDTAAAIQLSAASSTLRNLAKYGAFMSTVATAKTSDEVAAAIEAFVLPAGSARIKRQSNFNVALNAYVGLYGGGEYLPSLKKKATAFSAGLTAPVGIAISWGKKGCGKSEDALTSLPTGKAKGSSYTIFASLIDIGAAAAFRFGDTTSSITSTIQLKNIIAPGLYFYYGFRNSPFSLGLGAQMGPQLRKISSNDINIGKEIYLRFGLSFAVDLPLLNFYTKNK